MKRLLICVALLCCAVCALAQEGANPFTSHGPASRSSLLASSSPIGGALFSVLAPIQKELNDSLAAVTQSLQGSSTIVGLLLVLGLSLAYGAFHAAGPGHGKTMVSSFFVANEPRVKHVLLVGNLIALVHALSALTVVLVLSVLFRGIFSAGVDQANGYIQKVSFAIIAVIGLYLLVQRVRGHEHQHGSFGHAHGHDHEHGEETASHEEDGHRHEHRRAAWSAGVRFRGLVAIAVPAGMIPCPGAVAVIVFALSLHMLWVSVVSVAAMSVGMGITISLTALIVVLAKKGALRLFSGGGGQTVARRVIEIAGAAALFIFGALLLVAQF